MGEAIRSTVQPISAERREPRQRTDLGRIDHFGLTRKGERTDNQAPRLARYHSAGTSFASRPPANFLHLSLWCIGPVQRILEAVPEAVEAELRPPIDSQVNLSEKRGKSL